MKRTNENPNKRASVSQGERILRYLQKGNSITALKAMKMFDCLRLSGRIGELRYAGYYIETKMVKTSTGKRIASYFMPTCKTKGR